MPKDGSKSAPKAEKKTVLPAPFMPQTAEDKALISFAQELVRIPSITALDPADLEASRKTLDIVESFVAQTGADSNRMSFSGGHEKWDYEVDNLYVEWVLGTPEEGKPEKYLCYIGHTDVVPTGEKKNWSDDPFSGDIKDGYLYGRGITDMKGSVAAFAAAVNELAEQAETEGVNIRIGIVLTTDEEWAAVNGTRKILDWLKKEGKKPDAFIVGEPSSQDEIGSHIKLGRRGSLCGTFTAKGVQGHAAYTELFENPNRALSLALTILNSEAWADGNEYFPNTNFEAVATKSGDFNASAVIPEKAEALWNIRYTHNQTPSALAKWIEDKLKNPPEWAKNHPDADKLDKITVTANLDTASMPYYSPPASLAKAAAKAVEEIKGKAPVLDGSGGTTDGRFVQDYFPDAEIIELGLPERGGYDSHGKQPGDYFKKGGMHQIDERANIQDIVTLRDIFKATLRNYGTQDKTAEQKKAAKHDHNNSLSRRKP